MEQYIAFDSHTGREPLFEMGIRRGGQCDGAAASAVSGSTHEPAVSSYQEPQRPPERPSERWRVT